MKFSHNPQNKRFVSRVAHVRGCMCLTKAIGVVEACPRTAGNTITCHAIPADGFPIGHLTQQRVLVTSRVGFVADIVQPYDFRSSS